LAHGLFETLAPFSITVLDVEQIVIGGRLILSAHIGLNPAHAQAIETDLQERAEALNADIAFAISESPTNIHITPNEISHVLLLGDPMRPTMLSEVCGSLTALGANIERISHGSTTLTALHMVVSGSSCTEIRLSLSALSRAEDYEIAVHSESFLHARKMVVLDVDSTLIEQEVIDLLARRAGVEDEVKAITESAMKGELDFAQSLTARVGLLKGLPESVLSEVRSEITLTPGAELLVKTLQSLGHSVGLVTGGFSEVIGPLVSQLEITHLKANSLEIEDGRLTGRTQGEIIDRAAKARSLSEFATLESIPMENSIAIGDGANDLDMFTAAGLGIAFNAKVALRDKADTLIVRKDLARALDLLGIPRIF
jgi:phosphoserine phosphatase